MKDEFESKKAAKKAKNEAKHRMRLLRKRTALQLVEDSDEERKSDDNSNDSTGLSR